MAAAAVVALKKKNRASSAVDDDEAEGSPSFNAKSAKSQSAETRVLASVASSPISADGKTSPRGKKPASDDGMADHEAILKYQLDVYRFYNSTKVQWTVAFIITANFLVTIIEKEIDPYAPEQQRYRGTWEAFDATFNYMFLVELIINLYGSWFRPFWRRGWNIFDFIVVLASFLTMSKSLPESMKQIKMLRAFRVFRLFKRIEALNKIVTALIKAIPGVFNAFLIMVIIMAIYAILGVEYYSEFGTGTNCGDSGHENCYQTVTVSGEPPYDLVVNTTNVDSMSPRNMPYGYEYYGTFFRALYTLFQVLTGESWSEAVARPLIFGQDDGRDAPVWFNAIYFSSFIVITQIVLVNVVVAVLLDKFVTTDESDNENAEAATQEVTLLRNEMEALRVDFKARTDELQSTLNRVLNALETSGNSSSGGQRADAYASDLGA
eukprot:CAMPEP_0115850898 /NCGR_PEP_ID=MMETSP0287-20121206/12201_1 /TAXON_ID=412157 /ORGANISM="Chrysochromulina rotalis, Strain UIO044" /LENGTH=435 /DNA_ID=CAMNT_0003304909 /DNA_START=25 /DNA_END=1332 /DNA_ORIENTATION=+